MAALGRQILSGVFVSPGARLCILRDRARNKFGHGRKPTKGFSSTLGTVCSRRSWEYPVFWPIVVQLSIWETAPVPRAGGTVYPSRLDNHYDP